MAPKCFICGTSSGTHHKFPTDRKLTNIWLKNIGRRDVMTEPDYHKKCLHRTLCTKHFSDWCYTSTQRKQLIRFAVPCQLHPPKWNDSETSDLDDPDNPPISQPSSEQSAETPVKLIKIADAKSTEPAASEEEEEETEKDVLLRKLMQEKFTAKQYQFILSQLRDAKPDTSWSADEKALALSIYLQSASTYKLLRKYLNFPNISSLGCLVSSGDKDKQFYATVVKCLEKKVVNVLENDKVCIVSLNESLKNDASSVKDNGTMIEECRDEEEECIN